MLELVWSECECVSGWFGVRVSVSGGVGVRVSV
jgi:hypothetical protein